MRSNAYPSGRHMAGRIEAIEARRLESPYPTRASQPKVKLVAWLQAEKKVYTPHEDIRLLFLVANVGGKPAVISARFVEGYSIYPRVTTQGGKDMAIPMLTKTLVRAEPLEYVRLMPGDVIGTIMSLGQASRIGEVTRQRWAPGAYAVSVRWAPPDDGSDVGYSAWTGKLTSNEVSVFIRH